MAPTIWIPETPGCDGRVGELRLVGTRSFMLKSLKERGLQGWQAPTTAALLAAWELAERPVFFDIGANIGIYALLHNRRYPDGTAIAFEPTPNLVELGRSIASENHLAVRWEQAAVSDSDGEATLYLSTRSDASNSLVEGFRRAKGTVTVPSVTIDSYIAKTGIVPSVVKIDVESHEPAVLRGATTMMRTHQPVIVVEMIPQRAASGRANELLTEHGYHGRHLLPPATDDGSDPTPHRDWIFWPGTAPPKFDDLFAEWYAALDRCVPQT